MLAMAWALAGVMGGCSPAGGYLIRAVPADQTLTESVVHQDDGLWLPKVAIVDVDGLIVNARAGGLFGDGENPVSLLLEKLDKARHDPRVRAVVLRINSPGGTVQASETMYGLVQRFRHESGKPLIACITDVGASGGYYVACAAPKIICQPTTITGSIGVIIQSVDFVGTMKLIGIRADAITSGEMKGMGSPFKTMTEQERALFQVMVNEFYDQFIKVVAEGRPALGAEKARALADGRVYTGLQAHKLGLVDQLGTVTDAVAEAKKLAGIDKARTVLYHRPLGYRGNVYAQSPVTGGMQVNLLNVQADDLSLLRRPAFLYLWSTDLHAQ